MARQNAPFFAFNRGLVSRKALARVDLERTRLSAEVMNNWLVKTQGAMTIRPGTKWFGSSLNDTGAEFLEFVASTDDVALVELTHQKARFWLGEDAHELALLARDKVDTTVSLTDTGWTNASSGGALVSGTQSDIIPAMTGATTSGVTVTASSEWASNGLPAWRAADDNVNTEWWDTGNAVSSLPSWWSVDFGAGNAKAVTDYSIRAADSAARPDNAPTAWRLIASDFDTGTYAIDTGKWTLEDERTGETGWAVSEKRTYGTDQGDTGTVTARRHWRLYFTAVGVVSDFFLAVAEIEMFSAPVAQQASIQGSALILNATSIGALAKRTKRVIVSDTGTEHSLAIQIGRGPVTLRVGSTNGDDDYISEAQLGTGYHNLAFTPEGDFWITLQSDALVDRIVSSLAIGDSGVVEVTAPWEADDLDNVRYDQSADVVYADARGVRPQMIERRGVGRSWSVVDYAPSNGPFLPAPSSSAKLSVSHFFGNTTLNSDIPFFTPEHVGALVRMFHEGQSGQWRLGAADAKTDAIEVTGIGDTGTADSNSERRIVFSVSGTWTGRLVIERSFDGPDAGFHPVTKSQNVAITASDTGTFTKTIDDNDHNVKVYYRARIGDTGSTLDTGVGAGGYTSGVAVVSIAYKGGGITGFGRITAYNSNTDVDLEVLSRFSDTGPTDNWQQGFWSDALGFPTAPALHGGRLMHAQGGSLFGSVSDDFENFDDSTVGESGPIIKTLGSGPVDAVRFLLSTLRLIIGTAGAELTARSSSIDEPLTPENSNASTPFSTQGAANLRAVKMDTRAIYVQRSGGRLLMAGASGQGLGDYEAGDLTLLVPDLLSQGRRRLSVVSIAIQRQPDTRIHCALSDGTVAILTYEPVEEVVCWKTWSTDGFVERVMCLPGLVEDAVYYHIRRGIAGAGNDSFTKALLHFDGVDGATDIIDDNAGGSAHTWTANGHAQIDRASRVFGSSLLGDGTGDFVSTPDHADFTLGSGAFTIDLWFNCNAAGGTVQRLAGHGDNSGAAAAHAWDIFRTAGNVIQARVSDGAAFTAVTGTTQFSSAANTGWHHLAFVRTGNTLRLFIDGVQEGGDVAFSATVLDCANALTVGTNIPSSANDGTDWTGWIDEFRLSVGVARWTSSFTPPVFPYAGARRFLEKWAMESECLGDTGLSWLADCAVSYTDATRTATIPGLSHLAGEQVVVWADDTGAASANPHAPDAGKDLSPDVNGVQTTYTVDTGSGAITLNEAVHHAVAGLPYVADWKSAKLAYAAQAGTALTQMKRVSRIGFVLDTTHNRGLFYGRDSGNLDPLPRMIDEAAVDENALFDELDKVGVTFDGTHDTDARAHLRAKAPRPATVVAAVLSVQTNEKVG